MSHVSLTEGDYRWVTDELRTISLEHAEGRIVSVLEGGYNLGALAAVL